MIKLKDLLKENPKDFVDKNIDSKELLYRKKKYYIEAAKIKKVKNVSVQYMDAEYQGETLHGFRYFKKGPWLYKKDNGEYFAVVITNKNNRYEIQLGKHKNNIQATAAVEKIIKRNLNKFESVNENKSDKKTFDKIVKALKDVKVRATIHLNDNDKITIALGRDYFRKKNLKVRVIYLIW